MYTANQPHNWLNVAGKLTHIRRIANDTMYDIQHLSVYALAASNTITAVYRRTANHNLHKSILIILGRSVTEKVRNQKMPNFLTTPNSQ